MIKLNEKGFTLVEIMIVVAIIAILSAIAIPNFMTARSKSRANACRANLRQIDAACEQVAMDLLRTNGDTCLMGELVPTYIKKTPQCQSSAQPTYGETGVAWIVNQFEIGSTPWCLIGGTSAAGNYAHYLYLN